MATDGPLPLTQMMFEWVENIVGVINHMARDNSEVNSCVIFAFPTTNPTCTVLKLNPRLCGEKPTNKRVANYEAEDLIIRCILRVVGC